jgi:hypothetical protein
MVEFRVRRFVVVVLAAVLGAAVPWSPTVMTAGAQSEPFCEQDHPLASSGTLQMDSATVVAGSAALALVTGLDQWPTGIIGGGSGETFLSCTPWAPAGVAEVTPSEEAAFLLVDVPEGAPPGTYPVSVRFFDPAAAEPTIVRLETSVTVTSDPVDPEPGSVCGLDVVPAAVGELGGDESVVRTEPATISLGGVGVDRLTVLNEYDRLWFVACLDGVATPVVTDDPTAPFVIGVPRSLEPGTYGLRVLGVLDGEFVSWERSLLVVSDLPTIGTVKVERADCSSVVVTGTGWLRNLATIELAIPPSEGGESIADVVAGPVQVVPDGVGDLPGTELRFGRPPVDGRYAVVVLVDGIVREQSAGFELSGCDRARPLSLSG